MKKKNLLVLSCVGLMSLIACGSTGGANVDQYLPTDDPSSPVDILFWHCIGHTKGSNVFKIIDAFNAKYAGKYNLVEEHIAGDYDGLESALRTKLAANEIPALAIGYPDSFSQYMSEDIGDSSLLRLDNFIKDPTFGYSASEIENFVPGYYAEGTGYQFDGTWSMPLYKSTEVVFYNASYFAGANDENAAHFAKANDDVKTKFNRLKKIVDDAQAAATDQQLKDLRDFVVANGGYTYSIPEHWDDFLQMGRDILKNRKDEGVSNAGITPIGYDSDSNLMITQMAQRGIPYTQKAEENDDRYLFNNEKTAELLTEITNAIAEGVLTTKGCLGKNTSGPFGDKTLFASVGSTGGTSYNISAKFRVGIAHVPYSDKELYIQQGPSICFFDNEDPYVHKGAWLFYQMLADPAANAELACLNNYDPIRVTSYDDPFYKEWISTKQDELAHYVPNITKTLVQHYMTSPVFPGSSQARTSIGDTIKNVAKSGDKVAEALARAYGECTR